MPHSIVCLSRPAMRLLRILTLCACTWFAQERPAFAQDPTFPLAIAPGGRHFIDQKHVPFYVHGDTPWSLTHNLTFEEAARYMQTRKAQGFNTLLVSAPDASMAPARTGQQAPARGDRPLGGGC